MNWRGLVVSLHIAPTAAAPIETRDPVEAVVGRGIEGDRYFAGVGTFSREPGSGRHLTLIEAEALEGLKRDYGIAIAPGDSRRNVVTRAVPLNHLVGREFLIGNLRLRGTRLCEPCAHLEKLTERGALRGLVHRGGLRAEILIGGTIRVDDPITVPDD
ncbi:MAG TPA: MOSC domain-containing protein [Candidatus Binatia bacterium]